MGKKDSIYVRYLYATEKGLKMLEAMSEGTDEFIIQRIPKEQGTPPLPPLSFVKEQWKLGEIRV